MQHRITANKPLLDKKGRLAEAGYATRLILDYDRSAIKAGNMRIKEWDYYFVTDGKIGVALTIADNSYMGLDSISYLDFTKPWQQTTSTMRIMPQGRTGFPSTSEAGNVEIYRKNYFLSFKNDGEKRTLSFKMDNFCKKDSIKGEITLQNPLNEDGKTADTMVIATPFPKRKKAFYYNQKINCMPASGYVELAGKKHEFDASELFGLLDWGRGVWTYRNTWYWGSASGLYEGESFGFNIGYGFGDNSAATENMLFYKGKAHKLSQVTFNIPQGEGGKEDYMKPWTFTSDDGRFEMDFVPVIDRAAETDFKLLCSRQHQVFGKFSGKAVLDGGTVIELKDFFGFAEKVFNKW